MLINKPFVISILLSIIILQFNCAPLNSFDDRNYHTGLFIIPVHLSANNYKNPLCYYASLDEGHYVGDDLTDTLYNNVVNFIYDHSFEKCKEYHLKVIIWDKLKIRFDSTLTFLNSEGVLSNDTIIFVSDTVNIY